MNQEEIRRLGEIEKRVDEIFKENGLRTTSINFEVVTAERMIEALAYRMPTNFHHWSFGRDFEKTETQYRYWGAGIPYEVVWNFNNPTALLVDTNPFALNALIIAHVFGHVDFHLSNMLMKRGRNLGDVITDARSARKRFLEYEKLYGQEEVEKVIDAALSFQYHHNPDPFADALPEEEIRERRLAEATERLNGLRNELAAVNSREESGRLRTEILDVEQQIEYLEQFSPPEPEYDILKYLLEKSPKLKKPWVSDVVSVVREQMKAFAPNMRTRLLNEGWATYWHAKVLRQLAQEKLITPAEREEAIHFHALVTQQHRTGFNVYCIGPAFWEMIEDRWNKGQFGPEWEQCDDREKKTNWDKKLMLGRKKILDLRQVLSDRMAIESYFDDDFIRDQQIYIWQSVIDPSNGDEVFVIAEDRPAVMRQILINQFSTFGPSVAVINGNFGGRGDLCLRHFFSGHELDPKYENGALEKLFFLWGRPVYLITYELGEYDEEKGTFQLTDLLHVYDGVNHVVEPCRLDI